MANLRERIRASLKAHGRSTYAVAAEADEAGVCHRSTVYRYLSEGKPVSSEVLEWLIEAAGLSIK